MNFHISTRQIFLFLALMVFMTFTNTTDARDTKGRFVVIIDAGHGGKDTGAIGKRSKEKDIVLSVALKVGEKIKSQNPNITIYYTRDRDEFIGLRERASFANRKKADLFVSIHANANRSRSPRGSETYVLGLHRTKDNLEVAMKENSAILYEDDYSVKYADFDPQSDESYIMFQFIQNKHLDASIELADLVQKGLVNCGLQNRGVKQAGFLVLREVAMPSILVELGFISNYDDESFMLSSNGQNLLSSQIANSVIRYERALTLKSGKGSTSSVKEEKKVAKVNNDYSNADGTYYRIQVMADKSEVSLNSRKFRRYKEHITYYMENGYYKYTIYNTTDLNEARRYQKELRKHFKDCFIVGFNSAGDKVGSYY